MIRIPTVDICECGKHAFAPATKWGVVLVDSSDSMLLAHFGWSMTNRDRLTVYAASFKYRARYGGSGYLHRAVRSEVPLSVRVDHKNGNGLDCRRDNLRLATQRQNTRNKKAKRAGTSKYLGVHFCPPNKKNRTINGRWIAQIKISRPKFLGSFRNEEDAAICYNYAAAYHFGEFAKINRIESFAHD
jgi:hypothetical protein